MNYKQFCRFWIFNSKPIYNKINFWSTWNACRCRSMRLSHHPYLICEKVEQIFIVSQECSAVKFLQQSRTEEHHILHHCAHLSLRPLALTVWVIKWNSAHPCFSLVFFFFLLNAWRGQSTFKHRKRNAVCFYPVRWDECCFAHRGWVCAWCPWRTRAAPCGNSASAPVMHHQGKTVRSKQFMVIKKRNKWTI